MKHVHSPSQPRHKSSLRLFQSATLVTLFSVAERGLGFLYRIVLSRFLGAEGVGLYQVALSLFAVFLTFGTGGIPITVSRLICKSKAEGRGQGESEAVGAGVFLCLLLTLPVCILLICFPNTVGFLFTDKRGIPVFRILLIGLVFSSLYAVIRGSFWGNKRFLTPSVLELLEECVMVIVGVLLLTNVTSISQGVNRAAWAVVISYLFSFSAATLCFFFYKGKLGNPKKQLKPLFNATLPITSVRACGSLVNSAIAVLLPAMLVRAGASESEALTVFGVVSGMAIPVLFIPATIIGSLSLVLVPQLSEDFYAKKTEQLNKNLSRGLTVSVLVSLFLIPFFYVLGDELGMLAFSEKLAGEYIRKGSVVLLPMSVTMISTSMLNSMGFEKQTFIHYFIGQAAQLLCILLLPSLCGGYAYVLGMGAGFVLNGVFNLVLLGKKCPNLYREMRKQRGHGRVHSLFIAAFCALPLCLFGDFLVAIFSRFCGAFLSMSVTGVLLAVCTLCIWLTTGILTLNGKNKKRKIIEKKYKIPLSSP